MNVLRLFLSIFLIVHFSCKKDKLEPNEPDPIVEDDCKYQFELSLSDISGVWEPKQIINLEEGDTSNYDIGEGPNGFMLYDYYADSFELRPDSNFALYYVESGRYCESRVDGTWYSDNDTLFFSSNRGENKKLPILALSETELVVEDSVNFKFSKSTFRKIE